MAKGAKRVIVVDYVDYRLEHAKRINNVETINFEQEKNIGTHLKEITQGGAMGSLVTATQAVRKGGTIQVTGVYGSRYNAFPLGDIFNRNVNLRTGQAPVIHYMPCLYDLVTQGKIDSSDVITHVLPLEQAKHGYEIFDTKTEGCIKVVLKPH